MLLCRKYEIIAHVMRPSEYVVALPPTGGLSRCRSRARDDAESLTLSGRSGPLFAPRGPRGKLRVLSANSAAGVLTAARVRALDRRALHRTERAEDAAIARCRTQQHFAVLALVEELAGILRHSLALDVAAFRASQVGPKHQFAHRSLPHCGRVAGVRGGLDER